MAYASHNIFEGSEDDAIFDQYFDQHFNQTFENFTIDYGNQEEEKKRKKNSYQKKS